MFIFSLILFYYSKVNENSLIYTIETILTLTKNVILMYEESDEYNILFILFMI